MTRQTRTLLREVSAAYCDAAERYERHVGRGDYDRADEQLSRMQEIERCVSVREVNTSWRTWRPSKGGGR